MAKKEPLTFSIFELAQEEGHPSAASIEKLIGKNRHYENGDGYTYLIYTEQDNDLLWVSFEFGASHPRPEHVIDKSKDNEKIANPRTEDQVEPTKQLFCVYHSTEGNLYVSDSRKRLFLEKFLNDLKSDNPIYVKRVIIDPEEFLAQLKIVDKMKVTAKTDLLSQTGHLFQPVQDIFGLGAPEYFEISASYGMRMEDRIKSIFRDFHNETKQGTVQKFICVGKNEEGIETVFNTENFTQKIVIYLYKQDNGLFKPEEVKGEILSQLNRLNERAG